MSGNLSHQIEHHLFPDLPSNRTPRSRPRSQGLFERYGLPYNAAPLSAQVGSAWHKVLRLSAAERLGSGREASAAAA